MRLDAGVDDPRGTTFECAECDHQTSLTAGTLLEKTRRPLKMWFPNHVRELDAAHGHLARR
jgi:hypothetical protein